MSLENYCSLLKLQPELVWKHFATLCSIPRQSKHEEKIREYLLQWGKQNHIHAQTDQAGNVLLRKQASPGFENKPGIILQGHLDMVCQKNTGVTHDFQKDPIKAVVSGNNVIAKDTTLGADDGIGVALALAALSDESLQHPQLEALLTVDEEQGMGGAKKLSSDLLTGKILLNLDSEQWADFCLGCAGGMDIVAQRQTKGEKISSDALAVRITVQGLKGGHSGIDIHLGRGNAIKILARILSALSSHIRYRLSRFVGGTARNALPREAHAVICISKEKRPELEKALQAWQALLKEELKGVDDDIELIIQTDTADLVMPESEKNIWIHSLHAAPHGVWRLNPKIKGIPESSNNLGTVDIQADGGQCTLMVRSTINSTFDALGEEIASLFALSGTQIIKENPYPAWTPDMESALLEKCRQVYREQFASDPATHVIHAGLECGILQSKYPNLQIISFGPTIISPHAPGESVQIDTVAKCWQFLRALIPALS